jgi:MFS family permease
MISISTKKEGFYGWVALGAVALLFFLLNGGVLYSFGAFLPSICRDFGWKRGDVSAGHTVLTIMSIFTSLGAGFFVARFGSRRAIVAGNLVLATAMFFLSFLSRKWQFLLGYGVFGIGMGFGGHIPVTTIASNWFVKKAPLAMSLVVTAAGLGGLVIVPLVMAVITRIGWREAYQFLSIAILIVGVIAGGLLIRNKPEDLGQVPDGPGEPGPGQDASRARASTHYVTPVEFTAKEAMKTGAFWMLAVFGTATMFVMGLLNSHQIAFLTGMGVSNQTAALATGMMPGASVAGTLGMGFLALRVSIKKLTVVSGVLILISTILALLTTSAAMGFAYSVAFGLGFGVAMVATLSFWPSYFGRSSFSKIVGIAGMFRIVGAVGAPVGGFLYDSTKSYTLPHIICVAVALVGLVSILMLKPPLHPSLKATSAP